MPVQPSRLTQCALGVILALSACGPKAGVGTEAAGPTLEPVGSVVLAESETFLVSKPSGLTLSTGEDRFIVSDMASGKVLRWTTDGSQRSSIAYTGTASNAVPNAFTDSLWVGLHGIASHTAIGLLVPGADSVRKFVRLPSVYDSLEAYGIGRISTLLHVRSGTATMVGFGALNGFYLLTNDTVVTDSMVIPVVRRRGISATTIRTSNGDFAALANNVSVLSLVGPSTHPGRILTIHYDPTVTGTGAPQITARLSLSILDFNTRTACVDAEVPTTGDARPVVQLVGDSLFVLRQSISGMDVTTHVDQYHVSDASCTWLPMQRGALIDP